jgi:gamma-glutamyltranspeptidase / glutathione hydrolase
LSAKNCLLWIGFASCLVSCATTHSTKNSDSLPFVKIQSAEERSLYEAIGTDYMIAAQGREAAAAAKSMYEQGGNAIDAAAAASFVISVERPQSTGLGGGGFMLFRHGKTKKVYAIDFRERAPLAATRDMYLDNRGEIVAKMSLDGIHATAVPGMVAGVLQIHRRFGVLSREKIMAPAIDLARKGVVVYPRLYEAIQKRALVLQSYPATKAIFFKSDGTFYAVGERIVQNDLANTLSTISRNGEKVFYRGSVGQAIIKEVKRQKGILTERDLRTYTVKWREPIKGSFKKYQIYSMPPPSSGGIHVVEILNILENKNLNKHGLLSSQAIHFGAAAMQMAFADRAQFLGDPDFVKIPTELLLSKQYALQLSEKIPASRAMPSKDVHAGNTSKPESLETTHFSIMDKSGDMVASTQTINFLFGSGIVADGTGILLNDEMDDFSAKPGVANVFGAIGGEANAIAPGKTPLSSMSPTLVLESDTPVMAIGAPGGTRIITCVVNTILNYLEFNLPLYDSVALIRYHHQWLPERLDIDLPGPGKRTVSELEKMGYTVNLAEDAVSCRIEVVAKEGEQFRGVADPRDLGASFGR